ncbi:hypothetical protein [Streptomyces sp. NPDC050988]|uniref:hypothetical protein n=1 Tax=Streptomyces sp. NPDC050988 TaxID=3365637 RepID=UPI0037BBE439
MVTTTGGIGTDKASISGSHYSLYFEDGHLGQDDVAEVGVTVWAAARLPGYYMSRVVILGHDHRRRFDGRKPPHS